MSYHLERIEGRRGRRAFVDVPRHLMAGMRAFVPPLTAEAVKRIDPATNPFFEHAEAALWILRSGRDPVGRISATIDRLALDWNGDGVGVFGHFLAPDAAGARLLLDAARGFLAGHGITRMRGPIELSTNYTCGLQVTGFDLEPMLEINQHPPGQEALLLDYGLEKAKDLLSFRAHRHTIDRSRLERGRRVAERRTKAVVRNLDPRDFAAEIDRLHGIYERSWAKNFGFVPMTRAEFVAAARDFKRILVPELCQVAELDGEAVGFILGLPDVNVGIKACGGRLFPFGFLKLLRGVKHTDRFRVITLGILPELRGRGLDAWLVLEHVQRGQDSGYHAAELGWVLEDNVQMIKPIEAMGATEAMRHRLYEVGV